VYQQQGLSMQVRCRWQRETADDIGHIAAKFLAK
jgi:hypothetical protein